MMHYTGRYIKTKHGMSKQSIKTTKKQTLYVIGQGNGGGPAIWLAHLTIMFKAISSICLEAELVLIKGDSKVTTVGIRYFDDVILNVTAATTEPQDNTMIRRKIKPICQKWKELFYITRGKLQLPINFWAPIL